MRNINSTVWESYLCSYIEWKGIERKYEFEFAIEHSDWLMKVVEGTVTFNFYILKESTESYFLTILIHEFVHEAKQGLGNKSNVDMLKDFFGEISMREFDVEADLETFSFFSEKYGYSFLDFCSILGEGQNVFKSEFAKPRKCNRFLSTVLSIYYYSITGQKIKLMTSTDNLTFDQRIYIKVIDKEHYFFYYELTELQLVNIRKLCTGQISNVVEFAHCCEQFAKDVIEYMNHSVLIHPQ